MNHARLLLTPLFLAAALLGCSAIASAQTPIVYVSASGSDGLAGSRTSPVRTITHALSLVQSGGEVVVIDSGDYDQFTAGKSVTVEAAPGVVAVIPDLNNSIGINATPPSSGTVVLRGLTITSCGQPAHVGIQCSAGSPQGTLVIEDCAINGPFQWGIYADSSKLFVKGTSVVGSSNGVYIVSSLSSPTIATIERCRIEKNNLGLTAQYNTKVTVRDTVVSGNSNNGMTAEGNNGYTSELNVERCVVSGSGTGIITNNEFGGTVIVRVSDSIATDNGIGFYVASGTTFYTRGNNKLGGNSNDVVGSLTPLTAY